MMRTKARRQEASVRAYPLPNMVILAGISLYGIWYIEPRANDFSKEIMSSVFPVACLWQFVSLYFK